MTADITDRPRVYAMDGTEIDPDLPSVEVPTPVSTKPGPRLQTTIGELRPVQLDLVRALCDGNTTYASQARALGLSESYIGRLWESIRARTGLPNDDAIAAWAVPQVDSARAAAKTEARAHRATQSPIARSAGRADQASS